MPNNVIRRELEKTGILPFSRFMELALYCPENGYYEKKKNNVGRRGDFFTSVSVGNLFGELLAFQFSEWLEELRIGNCELRIIEAGAHDGKLAKDILNWLKIHRPKLFEKIEYIVLEPSATRQSWQKETLAEFENKIRWAFDFENLKLKIQNSKLSGVFFSNELLDAFPIRRFGWNAKEKNWFEWGVALENEKFIWTKIPNANLPSSIFHLPSSLLEILPDNYTIEISPAAENWWREAATILEKGKLLTFDYGLSENELFSPARPRGTLRAYFQHRISDDILANAGEQDLTAHVNFSAIQKAGEETGLTTEFFGGQSQFLTGILAKMAKDKSFENWNSNRARQFQTLTHPEHLGRAFRVLIQAR